MNKKDVILVAALINACLLALLFMFAGIPNDEPMGDPAEISQTVIETHPLKESFLTAPPRASMLHPLDEGDSALKEFQEPSSPTLILEEEVFELTEPHEEPVVAQPIAKAASPTDSSTRYIEVKVKRGDTLDKIARANNTIVKAIKEANQLKTDRLSIGQTLRIPVADKKPSTSPSKSTQVSQASPESSPEYYTVKPGDNPWKIAKQFHLKVDELLQLNNLDEERARNLKVGDKIRIR